MSTNNNFKKSKPAERQITNTQSFKTETGLNSNLKDSRGMSMKSIKDNFSDRHGKSSQEISQQSKFPQQRQKHTTVEYQHQSRNPVPESCLPFLANLDIEGGMFMKVAMSAYDDHMRSLVQCRKCLRKFFPDRIYRHEASCNAEPIKLARPH